MASETSQVVDEQLSRLINITWFISYARLMFSHLSDIVFIWSTLKRKHTKSFDKNFILFKEADEMWLEGAKVLIGRVFWSKF